MELFVGLDVSVRITSVCVMDTGGILIRESKETEAEAIGALLRANGGPYKRVGLEAGPLSQWLYGGVSAAGYPVICVETRHMKAALSAQINKTDRNDARGIAQMMRVGLYKPVCVKTPGARKSGCCTQRASSCRRRFSMRRTTWRGLLRNFGLRSEP